jgi:hypothetical protein
MIRPIETKQPLRESLEEMGIMTTMETTRMVRIMGEVITITSNERDIS